MNEAGINSPHEGESKSVAIRWGAKRRAAFPPTKIAKRQFWLPLKGGVLALLLASCDLAPTYEVPDTGQKAADYKENKDWKLAEPADEVKKGEWWKIFGDEQLNQLEDQIASANQNLKAAVARYDQARAQTAESRADYFPTINADAGYTRQRNSASLANVAKKTTYNTYLLGGDLSYEFDVWGRVRNEVAAASDRAKASKADLAAVDLSLHAELATDYFTLRGDDSAQSILDETVVAYGKAFDLTKRRHDGGVVSATDVDQAEAQLEDAKTKAADNHLKRDQLEHAIAVLVGKNPSEFSIDVAQFNGKLPNVDPGLPSALLERRPDVAEQERLVAAANAEIGEARAAWFPQFSLSSLLGFESAAGSGLLKNQSFYWSLGPSAVLTLFDGGRINALNDEARAAYNETVANYRQSVLQAYQDVEDNLVAIHQLDSENKSQTAATNAANRALEQAKNRYSGGVAIYTDVIVAQNVALQARLNSNDIQTRRLIAVTQLVKAIGGGWKIDALRLPLKENQN